MQYGLRARNHTVARLDAGKPLAWATVSFTKDKGSAPYSSHITFAVCLPRSVTGIRYERACNQSVAAPWYPAFSNDPEFLVAACADPMWCAMSCRSLSVWRKSARCRPSPGWQSGGGAVLSPPCCVGPRAIFMATCSLRRTISHFSRR